MSEVHCGRFSSDPQKACVPLADWSKLSAEVERLCGALNKPLRETILAVLTTMPREAAPEHLAAAIEAQVRAWQAIPPTHSQPVVFPPLETSANWGDPHV